METTRFSGLRVYVGSMRFMAWGLGFRVQSSGFRM